MSAGMNVLNFPEGQSLKATVVSPWYGVYLVRVRVILIKPNEVSDE
jgi:hypothetical protein